MEMDYTYFTSMQPYEAFGLPPTLRQNDTPPSSEFRSLLSPVCIKRDAPCVPVSDIELRQERFDSAFATIQQNFHYDPNAHIVQPQSPRRSLPRIDSTHSEGNGNGLQPIAPDLTLDDQMRTRSSSEEKETLTPAQTRRKAQNRAA